MDTADTRTTPPTGTEFATGGVIKTGDTLPPYLSQGCDYIIPHWLMKKYREELDRLNEPVLD